MHRHFFWLTLMITLLPGCTMFPDGDEKRWSTGWGTSNSDTSPRTDL